MHNIHKNLLSVEPNWQKELANSFTDPEDLLSYLDLPVAKYAQHIKARRLFPMRVPSFFASLMVKGEPNDPLLKQVLPLADEFLEVDGFVTDPLEELENAKDGVVHKYHNRLLLIVKGGCAVNCRYCFRRHFPYGEHQNNKAQWSEHFAYIHAHTELDEIILSGGDPLMSNDAHIAWLVEQIEAVPHIKRLRIHTRLPVVIPHRITEGFGQLLANSRLQSIVVLHINHPNEISPELVNKVRVLKQNNVTVLNQAVLLKDINATADTQMALNEALFSAGIMPYYLHMFDQVKGAHHFAIQDAEAVAIMQQVIQQQSGYMIPKLVREIGGEPSKTPINLHM